MAKASKDKGAAKRKADQRAREKASGVQELRLPLSPGHQEMLLEGQAGRGGEEPYTAVEYMLTLLLRDNELLKQQQGKIVGRICEQCRKPLPRGCGGVWADETDRCEVSRIASALLL